MAIDYEKAVYWSRKSAERGVTKAEYNLGLCCENGLGVAQNYSEAASWYQKAAEAGHTDAAYNLGNLYYMGWGVAQDYMEAAKWYRVAAEQGNAKAQNNLGSCCSKLQDYVEAAKWYLKAAEQGHAIAQNNIALCYFEGEGVAQDLTEAATWFLRSAKQDNCDAQYNLGVCYANGYGVKVNLTTAVEWYRKAAENGSESGKRAVEKCKDVKTIREFNKLLDSAYSGDAKAQYEVGKCYFYGDGVDQNFIDAYRWLRKAVKNGNDEAKYLYAECFNYRLTEEQRATIVAAEFDDADAQFQMGMWYYEGEIVDEDLFESKLWFQRAKNNGHKKAKKMIEEVEDLIYYDYYYYW